jgi:hypothetical protein
MGGGETVSVKGFFRRITGRPAPPGRLVLHLGDFKTGTTAIQTWAGAHGAAHGIATPPGFNQAHLAQAVAAGRGEAAFAALAEGLKARTEPHILLSAEHFELVDPAHLAPLLARHLPDLAADARAIVWVRPHPAAYLARLAESVKIGSHMGGIAAYLDRPDIVPRLSYGTRLAGWRAVFGDRLTVRLYDGGMDVVRDLVTFVTGRDPGPLAVHGNATPGLRDLARARALHLALGDLPPDATPARYTIGRAWGRALAAQPDPAPDTPLQLDRATAQALQDRLGDQAAMADAAHFQNVPQNAPQNAPMTAALARAVADAPDRVSEIDPVTLLSPDSRAEITRTAALIREGIMRPGGPDRADGFWHE